MTVEYKKFLAEKVLNDKEPVTYRSLSRALNVHSNLSKQMLYDFHRHENNKKPKSVNATYIIIGIQNEPEKAPPNGKEVKDGEDDFMQSSPFMSSMPQQDDHVDKPKVTSVTLVQEDDLQDAKSRFQTVFCIHIHSLQPAPLQDLNVLSDVGRETLEVQMKEDPLGHGTKYGMIQNKNAKRRAGIKVYAPAVPAKPVKEVKPSKPTADSEASSQSSKKDEKEASDSKSSIPPKSSSRTETKPVKKPAPLQRDKSDLFKAFAKAKPKVKKAEPASTASTEPSTAGDVVLDDASEEEREDLFSKTTAKDSDQLRKSRQERAENLKKMMEDDDGGEDEDEQMPDAPESPPEEEAPVEAVVEEPRKSEPREEVEVQGGRRRGRRQVMKKSMVKDEEGYLVTREEPVWESFSEDEKPVKRRPAVSVKPKSSKGGDKPKGNIMSFFSKK